MDEAKDIIYNTSSLLILYIHIYIFFDKHITYTMTTTGKPIPFITVDENNADNTEEDKKFIVNEEALNALRNIQTPIAVIAIAGLYRTGKSFLVNRIIGQQPSATFFV